MSRLASFELKDFTLPNGLRVLVAPDPHRSRVHLALYVRTGSRFEDSRTNGLSHFLEHMIYRGTPRLPTAHAVNDAFESLGGDLYAATQTDFGVFSLTLPAESLDRASATFGEVLREPSFQDIDVEKGIVCEEILEDKDDDGREIDPDNLSRALLYPDHPLGFTITGDEEHVKSFDRPMLVAHHARHYVARGSVLTFTGAVDPSDAERLALRDFGGLPAGEWIATTPPRTDQAAPRLRIVPNQSSQTDLRVCFRALSERSPGRAAMDVLMRVIDDGMSSRLYHRICDAQGLCYDVSAGYDGYEDDGVVDFAAGVQHKRADRVTREILGVVRDLAVDGPTEDELAKAKRRHAWDLEDLLDSPEDLAAHLGHGALLGTPFSPREQRDLVAAVTREEVRRVAAMLSDPAKLNVVAIGLLDARETRRLEETVMGFGA